MKPSGERPTMRYPLFGLLPPKNYYWKWRRERAFKAVENYKQYEEESKKIGEPKEVIVDIPETFNYLLGIKIKKIKTRNNGRKYLFVFSEKEGKDSWIDVDLKKDKEFIMQELKAWNPHIVYVNGQSVSTPKDWEVKYIEPEFKRLMEE